MAPRKKKAVTPEKGIIADVERTVEYTFEITEDPAPEGVESDGTVEPAPKENTAAYRELPIAARLLGHQMAHMAEELKKHKERADEAEAKLEAKAKAAPASGTPLSLGSFWGTKHPGIGLHVGAEPHADRAIIAISIDGSTVSVVRGNDAKRTDLYFKLGDIVKSALEHEPFTAGGVAYGVKKGTASPKPLTPASMSSKYDPAKTISRAELDKLAEAMTSDAKRRAPASLRTEMTGLAFKVDLTAHENRSIWSRMREWMGGRRA